MINTNNVLEKVTYNHSQPSGYIVAQNYLVVQEDGKRYLLIRFANESDLKITSFKFVLTQLDSNGKVIGRSKISYDKINFASQKTMSTRRGIHVREECVDFYIKIITFVSEPYRYEYRNGQLAVHYDVRKNRKNKRVEDGKFSVKSQKRSYSRFYSIMSFVAILLVFAACALAKFKAENGSFSFSQNSGGASAFESRTENTVAYDLDI